MKMLGRVFYYKTYGDLRKKAFYITEQIISPGLEYQPVMSRQKNVSDRDKIAYTAVNVRNTVGYVLPAGRMCFALEHDGNASTRLARRSI